MILIRKKSINVYRGELKEILTWFLRKRTDRQGWVERFEAAFRTYIGAKYAVAVSSGRFALYSLLEAYGIREGDEVILSAYNFKAVPETVLKLGAVPVFADIDPLSLNIDPAAIEDKVTARTRAVIVTHIFGYPAEIDRIRPVCRRLGLKLIEDCAHSCGAEYCEQKLGSIGDAAFFSFGMTKHLNTFGGGMATTSDEGVYKFIKRRLEENYGGIARPPMKEIFIGYIYVFLLSRVVYSCVTFPVLFLLNGLHFDYLKILRSRKSEPADRWGGLSDLQAYLGIKLLGELDQQNEDQLSRIRYLQKRLGPAVCTQNRNEGRKPTFLCLPLLTQDHLRVKKALFMKGIDSDITYMSNCAEMFLDKGSFPVASSISDHILLVRVEGSLKHDELSGLAEILHNNLKPVEMFLSQGYEAHG